MQVSTLTYYPDTRPGILRRKQGRGFTYLAPDGTRIERGPERSRIEALAVPPAYEDVWICPLPDGHLQATGRDARARKQYRYHPDWREWRDAQKYERLADFGAALPALRRRIRADLARHDAGDQAYAVAAILALLDRVSLRVGHADYVRDNDTFGATTLRRKHLRLAGDRLELRFRAKGGRKVVKALRDSTLQRTLSRLGDLPGPELVSWTDDQGAPHAVTSGMVNAALAEATGQEELTAKTFRTWNGSAAALAAFEKADKPTIKALSEAAAARLHNTPAMARKSYIHPDIIALIDSPRSLSRAPQVRGLRQDESRLLHLLTE